MKDVVPNTRPKVGDQNTAIGRPEQSEGTRSLKIKSNTKYVTSAKRQLEWRNEKDQGRNMLQTRLQKKKKVTVISLRGLHEFHVRLTMKPVPGRGKSIPGGSALAK